MAKKILIIEDDLDLIELMRFRLNDAGYHVLATTDPVEGLNKIRTDRPHLVLLDNIMPGKKGSEIVAEIRKDETIKNTPVIMISGKGEMYYSKKKEQFEWQPHHPLTKTRGNLPEGKNAEILSKAYQVNDYISKPFEGSLLLEVVKDVLGRPSVSSDEEEMVDD